MKAPLRHNFVMTLRGKDNPGALLKSFNFLMDPRGFVRDTGLDFPQRAPQIEMGWIRSFGPFGGVMIRLSTDHEPSLQWFAERANQRRIERHLHDDRLMRMDIHRTSPRRDLEQEFAHDLVNLYIEAMGKSDRAQQWDMALRQIDQFIAILATVPNIDICQYDQGTDKHSIRMNFRVQDLGGRGESWLKATVSSALSMATPYRMKINGSDIEVRLADSKKDYSDRCARAEYFGKYIESLFDGRRVDGQDVQRYCYVLLYGPDKPGMYSKVLLWLRRRFAEFDTPHSVERACCRGLGDDGFNLIVFPADDHGDDWMDEISQEFNAFCESEGWLESHHGRPTAMDSDRYSAEIRLSGLPPRPQLRPGLHLVTSLYLALNAVDGQHMVELINLIKLVETTVQSQFSDIACRANVFFLDCRLRYAADDKERDQLKTCMAIAVQIAPHGDAQLNERVARTLEDTLAKHHVVYKINCFQTNVV